MELSGLNDIEKRRLRRFWEDEEKIQEDSNRTQTRDPQVARRYDVNADLVSRWLRYPRFNRLVEDHTAVSFLAMEVVAESPILDFPINNAPIVDALVIEAAAKACQCLGMPMGGGV